MKTTQNEMILNYMKEYGSITQMDAMVDIGCMRLASRISDLKKMGHKIVKDMIPVKTRRGTETYIASYRIAD